MSKFGDTLKSQEKLENDYPQYSFALGFAVGLAKGLKGMVEEWEDSEGGLKVVDRKSFVLFPNSELMF